MRSILFLLVVALTVAASVATSSAQWTLSIIPTWDPPNALSGPTFRINTVLDPHGVRGPVLPTARAQFGPQVLDLTCSASPSLWRCNGLMDLTGLATGSAYELVVTATGSAGESAVLEQTLIYDVPPTINVIEPAPSSFVRGSFRAAAECVSQQPGDCKITIVYKFTDVSTSVSRVEALIDASMISQYGDRLSFRAEGPQGHVREVNRDIVVDKSENLLRQIDLVAGPVLDFDRGRILHRGADVGTRIGLLPESVMLLDRTTRTTKLAPPIVVHFDDTSALTANGALLRGVGSEPFVWNGETVVTPITPPGVASGWGAVSPNGRYLLRGERLAAGGGQCRQFLRDMVTGQEWHSLDLCIGAAVVADNGDFAFNAYLPPPPGQTVEYGIFAHTRSTTGPPVYGNGAEGTPVEIVRYSMAHLLAADGVNIAYKLVVRSPDLFSFCADTVELRLRDRAGNDQRLAFGLANIPKGCSGMLVTAHSTPVLLRDGWTAYVNDWASAPVIEVRSPEGTIHRLFAITAGASYVLEALGSHGEVLFAVAGERYWAAPNQTPVRVSRYVGTGAWVDTEFLISVGNTLQQIVGISSGPALLIDAGVDPTPTSDAALAPADAQTDPSIEGSDAGVAEAGAPEGPSSPVLDASLVEGRVDDADDGCRLATRAGRTHDVSGWLLWLALCGWRLRRRVPMLVKSSTIPS